MLERWQIRPIVYEILGEEWLVPLLVTDKIEAQESITAYQAVARDYTTGLGIVADSTISTKWLYVGIAIEAYGIGDTIKAVHTGLVTNPAWTWTVSGHPYVYVDATGGLTQTSPTISGRCIQQVGVIKSSTSIELRPRLRLLL